jgi:hypothetical protein
MRSGLVVLCLLVFANSALAQQYGVSNQRDRYGNLPRDNASSFQGVNQGAPNNSGMIRNAPIQPATNPARPAATR